MNRHENHGRRGLTGAVMALPGGTAWQVVSPTVAEAPYLLSGVAVASPTEVWVAGHVQQRPLIARWDGATWTSPPAPPPEAAHIGAGFQGIAVARRPTSSSPATSGGEDSSAQASDDAGALRPLGQFQGPRRAAEDGKASRYRASEALDSPDAPATVQAIAVGGGYDRVAGTEVPLLHHWDGSSWTAWNGWSDPEEARGYVLTDVTLTGRSGEDAWAVGHGLPWGGPPGPVALHWYEGDWRPAPMPSIDKGKLLAVSATRADDVWAVGAQDRAGLIMHYDGRSWTRMPCPSTRFPLTDVVALSPADAWAVGRDRVLHWNGRKWSRVKTPVTAANTVAALAPDDVWVAGGRGELAHFDGRRWSLAASPRPLGDTAVWLASTALPPSGSEPGGVWLVGSHQVTRTGTMGSAPSISAQSGDT